MIWLLYIFMFIVFGLGYSFLEANRLGNLFISDFLLVAIMIVLFIRTYKRRAFHLRKSSFEAVSLFVLELSIGVVNGASFSFILRDAKVWLYFFVVYWAVSYISKYGTRKQNIGILVIIGLSIISSLVQNWVNFFQNGLEGMRYDSITRTFDLGLSFSCAVLAAVILYSKREAIQLKMGNIVYFALQVFLAICVLASYTRTVWISYVLVMAILIITDKKKQIKLNTFITVILTIACVVALIYFFIKKYPDIANIFIQRLQSIFGEQVGSNKDTLSGRLKYVRGTLYKFESPRIIWGYGFGDTQKVSVAFQSFRDSESWSCENSLIYYCWKYGLIATVYLAYKTVTKVKNMIKSESSVKKCIGIYIVIWFAIGMMSGNFNSYYRLALLAVLMGFSRWDIFDSQEDIEGLPLFEKQDYRL